MEVTTTALPGVLILAPKVFADARGFFLESFNQRRFDEAIGAPVQFVQDNHSRSSHGVLRGMHFQVGDGMAKLVRCGRGAIVDVVVDLRRGSPTFGEWEAFRLDEENLHQLYCPVGFAHGFVVVGEVADVMYKCSAYYDESIERGIAYDDPDVAIEWPAGVELQVSARDASAPRLREIEGELPFVYEPALTAS